MVSYKPIIQDMTWSYSRIGSFENCPYRFFLRYIKQYKEADCFYASYGSFMHELLERYYKGEVGKEQMFINFLTDFSKKVRGARPKEETVAKYIKSGSDYLRNFKPFSFNKLSVEKKIEFDIDGIPFVGYIDLVGEKNGDIHIVDHKSRDLKPRSNKPNPTSRDRELDKMLRQLYLYSSAIFKEYGKFPSTLCFNCFRSNTIVEEPFDIKAYNEALEWAKCKVREIENMEYFYPNQNFFSCRYICGVSDKCIYHLEEIEERRRGGR